MNIPKIEKNISLGYVISNEDDLGGGKWLILDYLYDNAYQGLIAHVVLLDSNYQYNDLSPRKKFLNLDTDYFPEIQKIIWFLLHEQMIRKTKYGKFERRPASGLGEFSDKDYTHHKRLSNSNPLRSTHYWNNPGGKNLTIIDAIEWTIVHIEHCNDELPCEENEIALTGSKMALSIMKLRRSRRTKQGLIGTNKMHVSE